MRVSESSEAQPEPRTDLQAFAFLLRRLNGELNHVTHEFARRQGLHPTDAQALAAILDGEGPGHEPLTPGALSRRLNLTSGAVTAVVDRLERVGHIRRSRDVADRRVVHLHFAERALPVAAEFFRPLAQRTGNVCSRFDEDELRTVARFLGALVDELTDMRTDGGESAPPGRPPV